MTEMICLNESQVADLVKKRFQLVKVEFDHDDDYLSDVPDGVLISGENENGDEISGEHGYLELLDILQDYVEELGFKFYGCRILTISEGFGVVLLVKKA